MAIKKETGKEKKDAKADSLWRRPITLDDEETGDPLAALYGGREAGNRADAAASSDSEAAEMTPPINIRKKTKREVKPRQPVENVETIDLKSPAQRVEEAAAALKSALDSNTPSAESSFKLTSSELKAILKIKNDNFTFTDIREILRGKSLDMYAYLRHLAGDAGVCKIKHADLMKKLDISRPTLFKQADWLTKLSLIEKQAVPGDHFGTSYIVFRLENVLPVPPGLIDQIENHILSFRDQALPG